MPGSLVAELEKLQALHQSGALTDSEFGAAKAKLLRSSGGSTSAAPIVQGSAVPVVQAEQVVVNVASGSATVGGPRPAELDDLFGPTSQDDELEQQKVQKRFLELQRRSKDQDTTATTRNSFRHRYLMRTKTPPPRSDELRHEQELRAHFLKSSKERHKLFYSWFLPGTTVAFFLITFFDVLQEGEARRVEALEIAFWTSASYFGFLVVLKLVIELCKLSSGLSDDIMWPFQDALPFQS